MPEKFGTDSIEEQQGFDQLPDRPKDEEKTYGSDAAGIREAANELVSSEADLAEAGHNADKPIIERAYHRQNDGGIERVPENSSIKQARAARDLAEVREFERGQNDLNYAQQLAHAVDESRGVIPADTQGVDFTQPQPEAQPQQQIPHGVDPEVYTALQNPKIREAIQQEIAPVFAAREQYANAIKEAGMVAVSSMLSTFPELSNLQVEQFPVAMQMLQTQNPQRHAEIQRHLEHVKTFYNESQRLKAEQAQSDERSFAHYRETQSQIFDDSIKNENPETVKLVKGELFNIARDVYGIEPKALAEVMRTTPALHSSAFQRVMYDAMLYNLAKRSAHAAPVRNLPPVQRPGTLNGGPRYSNGHDAEFGVFAKNPTAKNAAAALAARRRTAAER